MNSISWCTNNRLERTVNTHPLFYLVNLSSFLNNNQLLTISLILGFGGEGRPGGFGLGGERGVGGGVGFGGERGVGGGVGFGGERGGGFGRRRR